MLFCSIAEEFCWISEIRRWGSLGRSCNQFLDSNPLTRLATRILFRIKDIFFRLPSCGWLDSIAVSLFVFDLVEFDKYYQITRSKYLFWYWGEVPCLWMALFRWLNFQQISELNAPLCWCKQKLNILLQKRTLVEIGRWSEKWESLLQSGRRDPLKYDPTCQRSRIIKMSPTTRASFHLRRKVKGKSWKVHDIYLKHLKIILKSLALVLVVFKSCLYQGYSEWRSSPISDMACQIHPAIPLHTTVLYVVHYRIRPRAKTVRVPHLLLEDPLVVHRIHSSLPASRNARSPLIKCRHRCKASSYRAVCPLINLEKLIFLSTSNCKIGKQISIHL